MKLRLLVEYDGTGFCGWQRQVGVVTVQSELESAFQLLLRSWAKKQGVQLESDIIHLTSSGRTDSGVHAQAQVVTLQWPDSVSIEPKQLLLALNGVTSPFVSVLDVYQVDEKFDARNTPHRKQYSYRLFLRGSHPAYYSNRALRVGGNLDLPAMAKAARMLVGQHDFNGFRTIDCGAKTTIRTIFVSEISRIENDLAVYIVQGNGFLKQMVRIIVGTLIDIGLGKSKPEIILEILRSGDRSKAGKTVAPQGLKLDWVRYSEEYLSDKTEVSDDD